MKRVNSELKCQGILHNLWLMGEKVGTLGFYSLFQGMPVKKESKEEVKKVSKRSHESETSSDDERETKKHFHERESSGGGGNLSVD